MTTQTEQTEQASTEAPKPEPTHHYVMTMQNQQARGAIDIVTFNAPITPPEGWTRCDVFRQLYRGFTTGQYEHLAGAQVLFFSLERNEL